MQIQNVVQLLRATAEMYPEHGLFFYLPGQLDRVGKVVTYPELLQHAEQNAARLHALGLRPDSVILLHFNNHLDNLEWFWAVTLAGFTPAMSTPFSNNIEQRSKHIAYLNTLLENPLWLTARSLIAEFPFRDGLKIQLVDELPKASIVSDGCLSRDGLYYPVDQGKFKQADDLAALFLTSGSTGNAKAVQLSQALILSSVAGKSTMNRTDSETPFFNWVGADHVACLTEIHMHAISVGANQIHAQAADLVINPLRFLSLIQRHRVAYTFAPNFFWRACDVSSKTPVSSIFGRFWTSAPCKSSFLEHGTPSNVLTPAFGMTETSAGLIYNHDFPHHDLVQQNEFASLGRCIQGMEMRVVNDNGQEVRSGVIGSLEVRGSNVFSEYYNNKEATRESFRGDWFDTGDLGIIDDTGMLNLTGRAKETLIINGVNYIPLEIEAALDDIEGTKASYTVAFPHRPKNSPTEGLCIVYCPTYNLEDVETRVVTNDTIAKRCMLQTSVRPIVIPLDEKVIQKTTLGKLSRTQVRKGFENGDYDEYRQLNEAEVSRFKSATYEGPSKAMEALILEIVQDLFELQETELEVTTNLLSFGITSIDIIKIKIKLEKKLEVEVPMITIISNPTVRSLAMALADSQGAHEYNPVVVLRSEGSKAPLWLIHPGVGEVLVFLGLASHITDRPVYAMRARGFEENEEYFANIEEAVTTYHQKIKGIQPQGPYAIAGYSFGLCLPSRSPNCSRAKATSEEDANAMLPFLRPQSRDVALENVLSKAPAHRMAELGLDAGKLANWANLAFSLQSAAVDYEPTGAVQSIDVFYAIPVASVSRDMDDWLTNYLDKWRGFCRSAPRFRRVDGAHYTMLNATHVYSFQKTLNSALRERGI